MPHWVQGNSEISAKRSNNAPPYLVAKLANLEFSEITKIIYYRILKL